MSDVQKDGQTVPLAKDARGSPQLATTIVTEIRARRDALADDERRARRNPRSRQILTSRRGPDGGRVRKRATARPDARDRRAV